MKQENNIPILIADFGRSGQGWLSYMLCYILNARFIEPYDFLHGKKYSKSEHVLELTQGNLPGREKSKYSMVVKTHEYPAVDFNLTEKIICLSRDPRDVAVSYYNMQVVNSRKYVSVKISLKSILFNCKVFHYMRTAYKWAKYYRCWGNMGCYMVKYEDLIADPQKALKGILAYLQADVDNKIIEKAIEEFSFEKITGRPRGQEDKNNLEFRKGIVGDYKTHFNKLESAIFKAICSKQAGKLGYGL